MQTPDGTLAQQLAIRGRYGVGINVLEALGRGEFEFGGLTAWGFPTPMAWVSAVFFGIKAVGGRRGTRSGVGCGRLLADVGFILSQALLEAIHFGMEALEEAFLAFEHLEELLGRKPSGLEFSSRLVRVHGKKILQLSCLADRPARMDTYLVRWAVTSP